MRPFLSFYCSVKTVYTYVLDLVVFKEKLGHNKDIT